MIHLSGAGIFSSIADGSSRTMAAMVSTLLFRAKARLPEAISCRINPKENWSER